MMGWGASPARPTAFQDHSLGHCSCPCGGNSAGGDLMSSAYAATIRVRMAATCLGLVQERRCRRWYGSAQVSVGGYVWVGNIVQYLARAMVAR